MKDERGKSFWEYHFLDLYSDYASTAASFIENVGIILQYEGLKEY